MELITKGNGDFEVRLIRGRLPTVLYLHNHPKDAKRRAQSLAHLHGVREQTSNQKDYTVDASSYYGAE